MSNISLEVEFKGLVAFVERPGDASIRVALMATGGHHHSGAIEKHTPLFVANRDDVDPSSEPDFVLSTPGDQHWSCWNVQDTDLAIDYDRVSSQDPIRFPGNLVLQGRPNMPDIPNYPSEWNDKAWLPDAQRILPGIRTVEANPSLFASDRPAAVVSRWPLQFGSMKCLMPSNPITRTIPIHFVVGSTVVPGVNQVFSDRVSYEVGFDDSLITITAGSRRILLRDSKGDGVVRAVFSNLASVPNNPSASSDGHFALYYDLLLNPPHDRPLPAQNRRQILSASSSDCFGIKIQSSQ
jgi:hypothetical protein